MEQRGRENEVQGVFRQELKYMIRYPQYLEMKSRLAAVMQRDEHAGAEGRYLIRSIYFDNDSDRALREKVDGIPVREKFRIRYYNDDLSYILLEKKVKDHGLCRKVDAEITKKECARILAGKTDWMGRHPVKLVRELYGKMCCRMLRPKVMVSYMREPYVYRAGNVRITFDSDIRTSLFCRNFPESEPPAVSVLDGGQDMILEIKYDAFLPGVIWDVVRTEGMRQQAFSKYQACRRFG